MPKIEKELPPNWLAVLLSMYWQLIGLGHHHVQIFSILETKVLKYLPILTFERRALIVLLERIKSEAGFSVVGENLAFKHHVVNYPYSNPRLWEQIQNPFPFYKIFATFANANIWISCFHVSNCFLNKRNCCPKLWLMISCEKEDCHSMNCKWQKLKHMARVFDSMTKKDL